MGYVGMGLSAPRERGHSVRSRMLVAAFAVSPAGAGYSDRGHSPQAGARVSPAGSGVYPGILRSPQVTTGQPRRIGGTPPDALIATWRREDSAPQERGYSARLRNDIGNLIVSPAGAGGLPPPQSLLCDTRESDPQERGVSQSPKSACHILFSTPQDRGTPKTSRKQAPRPR